MNQVLERWHLVNVYLFQVEGVDEHLAGCFIKKEENKKGTGHSDAGRPGQVSSWMSGFPLQLEVKKAKRQKKGKIPALAGQKGKLGCHTQEPSSPHDVHTACEFEN